MSVITLEAQTRELQGKGASRRLRRLQQLVPAVVYGSEKKPQLLSLPHHKVLKALENAAIFTSVFQLNVDGKDQQVILKDLQRHPYKPSILHMDFQRVSAKDVLVKMIPLNFINGEESPGHRDGGVVNHVMVQVEVRCEAQHLPEFIEVDLGHLELDQVVHLSDLKLPKKVELATELTEDQDHPVAGVHISRAALVEEALEAEEAAAAAEEAAAEASEGEEAAADSKETVSDEDASAAGEEAAGDEE
ncbi:MAG: 50S ribosomal protein L25/general stress protein Ctc [Gammaproteobacteria bacterium]|nr:50S ribosomal protein L25/general stress protein Ctc [Gammaproteobacteria bacterium]